MAGLLIKELILREAIERVLVLCPAPLTTQWQDEFRFTGRPAEGAIKHRQPYGNAPQGSRAWHTS